MTGSHAWRPATLADAAEIARLSKVHLGAYAEGEDVFSERIRLAPEGCFVLTNDRRTVGYFFSHPWIRMKPPALHQMLGAIPPDADCWYVHDVAVDRDARGGGVVADICARVFRVAAAKGFRTTMLVAVSGAGGYWGRLGFCDRTSDALRLKLKDYGDDAVYMERPLGAD
jgi:hypothetical protein